jgi:N6-L-threonylcarbamoyladenine synthase
VIISNVVASQLDTHRRYGGVVPEIASRQHILSLAPVIREALAPLAGGWDAVDAVAATYGPGLSGALLTGLNAAKAMAWQRDLPFIGVNHLEAHIYANWLGPDPVGEQVALPPAPTFPLVALVVSGGHTLLALLRGHGQYELLGQTRDDAAGEAFDKVARLLSLGYPGGPAVQQAAAGVAASTPLPRAWLRDSYDFSFSGLKTAVLHKVRESQGFVVRGVRQQRPEQVPTPLAAPEPQFAAELAHAFQESVVDVLVTKTVEAARVHAATTILLAGGVAANTRLREELARRSPVPVRFPPIRLCTDNAAMVAAAAFYRYESGRQRGWDLDVQPNLPLGIRSA